MSYEKKLTSPQEAVKFIKDNDRVVTGHAAAEPQRLLKALVDNASHFKNVEIMHMVSLSQMDFLKPEYSQNFRHNAMFNSAGSRGAYAEGRSDYTPTFFHKIPKLFREIKGGVDVAMIQVSAPDRHGFCSYGISCDYTKAASEVAKKVIAQVNTSMPYIYGDNFIHIDQIDHIVEYNEPILPLLSPPVTEVEQKIGEFCASLVKDGSTMQLGIGGIPNAVLTFMDQKNDLGIHSEMISDGVMKLMQSGNINNKVKTVNPNHSVVSFLMGSQEFYEFVDHNPAVKMYPVDYVNDPVVISKNYRMIAINSALQVDLMGQVNAETIGFKQFSGTGGQVDFVRGTAMSEDGISIIALPSTAKNDTVSRIVLTLDQGSAVTTSRNDVDYIVTEYGIADLKYKTINERAEALISIAHPSFRDELKDQFKNRFK